MKINFETFCEIFQFHLTACVFTKNVSTFLVILGLSTSYLDQTLTCLGVVVIQKLLRREITGFSQAQTLALSLCILRSVLWT